MDIVSTYCNTLRSVDLYINKYELQGHLSYIRREMRTSALLVKVHYLCLLNLPLESIEKGCYGDLDL